MSTCLTCINWTGVGVPRWAFRMGMACCAVKSTKAITLNHWAACNSHRPAPESQMPERLQWLKRCGVDVQATPRSGSFPPPPTAGHSRRVLALVSGESKW